MHKRKRELQIGHEWLHIKNQAKSATLTLKIGAYFFRVTRRQGMLNPCA